MGGCTKGTMIYSTGRKKCLSATPEGVIRKFSRGSDVECDVESDDYFFTYAEGRIEHRSSGKCFSSVEDRNNMPITLEECNATDANQDWTCGNAGRITSDAIGPGREMSSQLTSLRLMDSSDHAAAVYYQIGRDYVATETPICEVGADPGDGTDGEVSSTGDNTGGEVSSTGDNTDGEVSSTGDNTDGEVSSTGDGTDGEVSSTGDGTDAIEDNEANWSCRDSSPSALLLLLACYLLGALSIF